MWNFFTYRALAAMQKHTAVPAGSLHCIHLTFGESVYGMQIKVEFLKWVRPERKFHSLEELKNQMHRDIISGINYYTNITDIC